MIIEPIALAPREAAKFVGLSKSRIYELLAAGEIEARKHGARTLVTTASLRAFLDRAPAARFGLTHSNVKDLEQARRNQTR